MYHTLSLINQMAREKVKFWNSLVSRFALFFVGLNILAILIVGYLVYNQAATVITSHSRDRMQYTSNLAIKSFYSLLSEVANDIAVTTNNPALADYINGSDGSRQEDLETLFRVFLENKPNYFQIRLLNTREQGKEMLRYDKVDGSIVKIRESQLQFKGDRPYYEEALEIPRDTYYYSDINLNEEFGAVSFPSIPTLRAIGKVFDQQQNLRALLVINVDLSNFYHELNQLMESEHQLMIVNDIGDYLFAPDMKKCFGSQLNSGISFTGDFGSKVESLLKEQQFGFITDNLSTKYLYHLETLNYSPGQQVYLVNLLEDNLIFRSAYLVRNDSLKLVLLVCLISMLIALLVARIFSKDITEITKAMSSYEDDHSQPQPASLPENRKDELGILATTFTRMRKRIDQQFTDLKAALGREQQAIRERDQFLQNMSHELRTPLNAILGLTRLLNKNNPSKAQKPIIESLERSARSLSGLMHDVLDHQKLMEGKVHLNLKVENFDTLLSNIHAGYRYEAVNKGLSFVLEVQESLKHSGYLTDPLRFNQVITNLVVNSIKFTDHGFVNLKASTCEQENVYMLKVEVTDSGRGIQPENLQKIKDRFYQENKTPPTAEEGYGLGLSIVKQLVDLFGGSLEVSSELNRGSTFTVCLPLIPANTTDLKPSGHKTGSPLPALNRKYAVLHIEDDHSTLTMVAHALDIPGLTITQRTKIGKDQEISEDSLPDLVLSDLLLDNQSIDPLLLHLGESTDIPLIVLSASEPPRMKAITPYFLQKPFELEDLRGLVTMLLGRQEYDVPQLETIYEQYDHQPEKIRNFLNILQQEFTDYVERFDKVFKSRDQTEWEAIIHKLTTHIKTMKLNKLSQVLPEDPSKLDQTKAEAIKSCLLYCMCVFRYESRTLASV